ncbi:MAG: carbohydrate ABC transporter permease [Defluviitaleaceae bacterium]|jgi:ABC-type glycerol-3-phosphate transport system permease component|nr:carbohydrate ABC transporter permease [Defluviitaleaceae bacterium]
MATKTKNFNPVTRVVGAYQHFKFKRKHRSLAVDIALAAFLALFGFFSVFPLVLIINDAFKPLNELFLFPPRLFVMNPTLDNFRDLSLAMNNAWVPLSRYIFNTFFITIMGTLGTVFIGSMAAFPLAKYTFPGSRLMGNIIIYALMFNGTVTAIPNFIIMSRIGLIDTHLAIILPALGGTLGVFLMRNFMTQVPDSLVEAAKIDGANELKTWWTVVMPMAKPAWITLIILSVQGFWGATGATFIYTEALKPVGFAMSQIAAVGVARQGVFAAFSLIMLAVPVLVFVVSQSNVIETMASSGIKG